jgi:hypothetical protein
MHDPRMPFFDMGKPRVAYGADFVSETFRMMQHVHQAVKVNLEEAQECSNRYIMTKRQRKGHFCREIIKSWYIFQTPHLE